MLPGHGVRVHAQGRDRADRGAVPTLDTGAEGRRAEREGTLPESKTIQRVPGTNVGCAVRRPGLTQAVLLPGGGSTSEREDVGRPGCTLVAELVAVKIVSWYGHCGSCENMVGGWSDDEEEAGGDDRHHAPCRARDAMSGADKGCSADSDDEEEIR
eukprot:2538853-Rhodomonas_salina.1